MKDLYELGIVFRGFVVVNHEFKEVPTTKSESGKSKDLRGAFISAITSFAESAFTNTSLEYLEMGNFLFVFKISKVKAIDSVVDEPIILYGLIEKKKKSTDKYVKKFFEKTNPIIELFLQRYKNKDFSFLNQFEPFQNELKAFFT